MRETLEQPRFRKLNQGHVAGAPILRELWDRFDLSLLLMQSGISIRSGVPPWLLCFMYVIGLVSNCPSVNQMASLVSKDALLAIMFKSFNVTQYTMSRLFSAPYDWALFSRKRMARLQEDEDMALQDGDCINLDDTHIAHPYAKKLPFMLVI